MSLFSLGNGVGGLKNVIFSVLVLTVLDFSSDMETNDIV